MAKVCPSVHLDVSWPEKTREMNDNNGLHSAADQADQPPKHEWLQCMKEFKQLLFDAEKYLELTTNQRIANSIEEPIVVALIDDGINVNELEHSPVSGRSFCPRDENHNLGFPFYLSSSGHGTVMASQIFRICPRTDLYVLKLEDYMVESSTRQITLKSAAQVRLAWLIDGFIILIQGHSSDRIAGYSCSCEKESPYHLHVLDHRPPRRR